MHNKNRLPASLLRSPFTQAAVNTRTATARTPIEPIPPTVKVQVYEILRNCGFSFGEALGLAGEAINSYKSTSQRIFQFNGVVTVEISAGVARLMYAPRGHETGARTVERIRALLNSEIDQRAREIREKRERDERRPPW